MCVGVHARLPEDLTFFGAEQIQGAGGAGEALTTDVNVEHGGADRAVAEQHLDDGEVGADLMEVSGKCMAEQVRGDPFGESEQHGALEYLRGLDGWPS